MTAVDCTLENLLCEEANGEISRLDEIVQNDAVHVEEETCDDVAGVPEGSQDVVEMEEESRAITQDCYRCEGIYELNEELMRVRCGEILEDESERVSLEEGVVEELIFFSDDEDETDKVSGGQLDVSQTKNSDSGNVSSAGVTDGSVLAEEDDGDCVRESGIVFDPGENPMWTSGTQVDFNRRELNDVDETLLVVGDACGEERACGMVQCEASIGGMPGGSLDVESVDPPWAFNFGELTLEGQVLSCSVTSGFEGNLCPKSGMEEGSFIGASALGQDYFPMEETSGSQELTTSNVGTRHVVDPGEEPQHIVMNLIETESSSIVVGCWTSRLEQCCRDQRLGTATLTDGSRLQGGSCCVDQGKPVLRLRGGGSVPRKQGRRKSCGGRRIKPPAKRQRLGEVDDSTHEVRAEGLTGTGTSGQVVQDGRWLNGRMPVKCGSLAESEDGRTLLAGEAQPIRGRELDLNSLLCRLNDMAEWVSVSESVTFDEHIRGTSTRSVTPERPYGYRTLSVYHVLLFRALHPSCPNHLVNAAKIHAWRLATENGRTAMETLVLHNILRSDATEKCGKDPIEDEYLRTVSPMTVPLVYVLVAFSIGKTDEEKHALQSAVELTTWWINCWEQDQRLYSRVCKGYLRAVRRVYFEGRYPTPVAPVSRILEMDVQWSMFLRSLTEGCYPDDISVLVRGDVTQDPDAWEVPWCVYKGLKPGANESAVDILLRWRSIRQEVGDEFHRIMEPVLEYLHGKRRQYMIEDKLRESLDDKDLDESESEDSDGSEFSGGDSADSY